MTRGPSSGPDALDWTLRTIFEAIYADLKEGRTASAYNPSPAGVSPR